MKMTRREFSKGVGVLSLFLATAGSSFFAAGCGVMTDIINWGPVGLASFNAIIALLQNAGLLTPTLSPIIVAVQTGFADLIADAKAYEAVNPPPAGALQKVQEVFTLLVGNVQSLLAQIGTSGGTLLTLISGLAQIIFSTIAGFENQLPPATNALLSGTLRVGGQTVSYTATHRTRRRYKHDWNSTCKAAGHPEAQLPVGLFERL